MNNLKKIQRMINKEAEYYDNFNYRLLKNKKIQECDVELFIMLNLLQDNSNNACLKYFFNNQIKLKELKTLFRKKETGKEAYNLLKKTLSNLFSLYKRTNQKLREIV